MACDARRRRVRATASSAYPPDAERCALDLADGYLARLQAGETPDRRQLLAAHPDIAHLLEEHLRVMEVMHGVANVGQVSGLPGRQTPSQTTASSGDVQCLGRYLLHEEIGRGASATVHRAYDPRFDREVALKVLRRDRSLTADADDRFVRHDGQGVTLSAAVSGIGAGMPTGAVDFFDATSNQDLGAGSWRKRKSRCPG
jgi:hypothetical protein